MSDDDQIVNEIPTSYPEPMNTLATAPTESSMPGAASAPLAEMAYQRIEEMIVSRLLPPGAMISENKLSEDLGCGRTPIREALQRLKFEGYVEIHPRRGAQVTPIDVTRQLELLEVRRPLEDLAVRLAAARARPAERADLLRLADEIVAAAAEGDRARYLRANRAIHELRAQATHNTMLERTLRPISAMSRRFWYTQIEDTDSFMRAADLHAATSRAIAAGNATEAVSEVMKLLLLLEELSRQAVDFR
jgi:DNA-binding GntR family transcriptional regulator